MKKILLCVVLLLFTVNAYSSDKTEGASGSNERSMNLNLLVGSKFLDSDWGAGDRQNELGLLIDYTESGWPAWISFELIGATQSKGMSMKAYGTALHDGRYSVSTREVCIGAKKIWDHPYHPFIGGGLAYISGEQKYSGFDLYENYHSYGDKDSAIGLWFAGGVYYMLDGHFNIGLIARVSRAKVTLADYSIEAGGEHIGLLLGYHW